MKTKIATYATGIAMSTISKNNQYLVALFIVSTSLLFGCSTSKYNATVKKNVATSLQIENVKFIKSKNDTATIFGVVTGNTGVALSDVGVIFDGDKVATTDEKGVFSFFTDKEIGKMYQLVFSKDGYNKTIRTYNFEIENPNYEVAMIIPCKCDTITCNKCFTNNVAFDFEKESIRLNEVQKKVLDDLIECLKSNPEKVVTIQYNTLYPKKQVGAQRIDAILNYFILKGIMDNRIKKETVTNKDANSKQINILNY